MKTLHNGTGIPHSGFGFWQNWTSSSLICAIVFVVNICSLNGTSGSRTAGDQLNPIVNLDSLTKNNTDAAVTVNFNFENRKPSEAETYDIYNKTRLEILGELNRRTDEPTTVASVTQPSAEEPSLMKRRNADDYERAAGETIFRKKRDDSSEDDDLYTEEDLPFVNINEWFKDGVLRVALFILNDKGPHSKHGDWNLVGDRLYNATTTVKDKLLAETGAHSVTLTRGLPEDAMASTSADVTLGGGLILITGLLLVL